MADSDSNTSSSPVKLALAACFAGLLALLIGLGFYAARSLNQARTASLESTRLYLLRREALADLRTGVYTAGSHLRDYLVDPSESREAGHAAAARNAWERVLEAKTRYTDAAGSNAETEQLRRSMARYSDAASHGLSLTGRGRTEGGYRWLSESLGPARDGVSDAVEQLVQSDNAMLKGKVDAMSLFLGGLEDRLWMAIGLSLVVGVILAVITYRYLSGLEALAEARYRQSLEAKDEMEQLSRRLLDVQEGERKSLARELHDEVGQCLGALLVDLGQARSAGSVAEASQLVAAAAELGERALHSVRDISLLLRPSMLDDLGLIPALKWQAREINRRTGIAVNVRSDEEELDLSEELRTTIYRVVQEALNNAARHSAATSAEVAITLSGDYWRILVTDNGKGFDSEHTKGLGLLGMQERVMRLGGRLRILSTPGQGTAVTVELPAVTAERQADEALAGA